MHADTNLASPRTSWEVKGYIAVPACGGSLAEAKRAWAIQDKMRYVVNSAPITFVVNPSLVGSTVQITGLKRGPQSKRMTDRPGRTGEIVPKNMFKR
eukprot:991876-Pelagomonas_calceolata.AAC.1